MSTFSRKAEWNLSGSRRVAQAMMVILPLAARAGQIEDAKALAASVEILWPENPWSGLQSVLVFCMSGQIHEALSLLGDRADTAALALRVICLRQLDDLSWQGISQEVLDRADCESASDLMMDLRQKDGLITPESPSQADSRAFAHPFIGAIRA